MWRILTTTTVTAVLVLAPTATAWADNPPGTGQPGQSCQAFSPSTRPGNTATSPGSPFNEGGGVNSANGGIGGQNYSESSQYDVACFQWAQHHQ